MYRHTATRWLCGFKEQWPSLSGICGMGSHLELCDPTEVTKALGLQFLYFSYGATDICLPYGQCHLRSLGLPSSVLYTTPLSASQAEAEERRRKNCKVYSDGVDLQSQLLLASGRNNK